MNDIAPPLNLWFDPGKCFIGGTWVSPDGNDKLPLENPSDGSTIGAIARGRAADIDRAVAAARAALDGEWGRRCHRASPPVEAASHVDDSARSIPVVSR